MTITSDYKKVTNAGTEELLAVEVTDIIWHIGEPTEAPLISLTGGKLYTEGENKPKEVGSRIKREVSDEVIYKVIEKEALARTVTVNGTISSTSTTTVVFDSNTNLRVGDTIKNITQENGEMGFVYSVDSGGTDISLRRNLGSTTFEIADADVWKVVGFASKDGGAKAGLKSQLAAPRSRRTQIFKRSFGVTDTLRNVMLETKSVDYEDEETMQAMVEHKKDIDFSFWMNANVDSTTDTGSNTVNLTRGIIAELTASGNTINGGGGVTESYFFSTIAENIFEFGPTRKTLFLDPRFKSIMGEWSRVKQQTKPKETQYGINLIEIETNHGILELITAGVFGNFLPDSQSGYGVVMDLDRFVYKFIKNRDTKFDDNIETPGDDVTESQFITECGGSLRNLSHHDVVFNIA